MEPSLRSALAFGAAVVLLLAGGSAARATVEMQKEARKAGFQVTNCLYCHASKHAAQVMKAKARQLNMNDGNCLLCHGTEIPAALNERGEWLVTQRIRRGVKRPEMKWLADYVEPEEKPGGPAAQPNAAPANSPAAAPRPTPSR